MSSIKRFFPSQLLVPTLVVALLVGTIATSNRDTHDPLGRPVVVYAHPPCPPDLMAHFEAAFADFRSQHPDIDLRVLHITGQYEDKVKIMFAGNVAPDVIFMYPTSLPAWVDLEALQPLDAMLEADAAITKEDYFPAGIETFTRDGQLYGLPKDASADLVFYNRQMFLERGVPLPTDHWTWDDYRRAAEMLTQDVDGDGRVDVYGAMQPKWQLMVRQAGGQVISPDGSRCLLDEPAAIAALTEWADLRVKYNVTPTLESTMDSSSWQLFSLQKLGMFHSMYPATVIVKRSCDFDWDIAAVPRGPAGAHTEFTGSALAVTRQSKNQQAAYTFARWMTSQGMRHVMSFDIPCYKPLGGSDIWRDDNEPPASKDVAVKAMQTAGPPVIQHPAYSEILDAIEPHLDRVNRGQSTVRDAVDRIVPEVNAILTRHQRRQAESRE